MKTLALKTRNVLLAITIGAVLTLFGISEGRTQQEHKISIVGTYKLTSRKLPDSTIQKPPDIMGLYTCTKKYKNFNLLEKNDQGGMRSVSIMATYKLTATQYSETLLAFVVSDQASKKEVSYDVSGKTRTSPVTVEGGRIQFKPPFSRVSVSLVFKGDTLTAAGPGFVDTWERVQ